MAAHPEWAVLEGLNLADAVIRLSAAQASASSSSRQCLAWVSFSEAVKAPGSGSMRRLQESSAQQHFLPHNRPAPATDLGRPGQRLVWQAKKGKGSWKAAGLSRALGSWHQVPSSVVAGARALPRKPGTAFGSLSTRTCHGDAPTGWPGLASQKASHCSYLELLPGGQLLSFLGAS